MARINLGRKAIAAFGMAGSVFATAPALAQDRLADDAADEIVVTAQKRAENVQDVPISIAAFSGETLGKANVLDVRDLQRLVPNFTAFRATQAANVRLNIRGIGAASNTATEPSVASFIDGVYVARPGAILTNFLDIEAVEVLRGPQGTLQGRNASVGAISLRTAAPKSDLSARVDGEAESFGRYKLTGVINLPLSDTVAVRVAGLGQSTNGIWKNTVDGKTYGAQDDYAGRFSLKADLASNLIWTVRADYSRSTGDGFINSELMASSISEAQLAALNARLASFGAAAPDTNLANRLVSMRITADMVNKQWGLTSDLSWEAGEYTLRLLSGYRDWRNTQTDGDTLSLSLAISTRRGEYVSKGHSQELQLISPEDLLDGHLNFVAGLYYYNEDYKIGENLDLDSQYCNVLVANAAQRTACNGVLATGGGSNATVLKFNQSVNSYAGYAQATYELVKSLKLTLGGRWTRDEKDGRFTQLVNTPFAATLRSAEDVPLTFADSRFTWRASLNWKPSDDALVFANYSTGYKSGGFNSGGGTPALGQRRLFANETVKNYELGAKTTWLQGQFTLNATAFRMDIAGFQDRSFDGLSFVVRNAGNLRQQGIELDAAIRPVRNFAVNFAAAYLDSKFTDYKAASGLPGVGGTRNITGTPNAYSPKWQGTFGLNWSGDLGKGGLRWSLSPSLSFISDYYQGINDGNTQNIQDGYATLQARLSISGPEDRWTVAVFGNNLTNKTYCQARFYQTLGGSLGLNSGVFPGSAAVRCQLAEPRSYGVSGTIRF